LIKLNIKLNIDKIFVLKKIINNIRIIINQLNKATPKYGQG